MNDLTTAADQLAARLSGGGFALCVHGPQGERLHLARGENGHGLPWSRDTLAPVWSTTKGPAAAALLVLLERHGLPLQTPVRQVWPQFHHTTTLEELLSHQAGLAAPDVECSVFDHAAVSTALAQQPPNWPPGTGHGYHPRTFGFLLDEIARRLTGRRLGEFWQREIAAPLGLDFFIGLPESEFPRVAKVSAGRARPRPEEGAFITSYMQAGGLTRRAFDSLKGLNAVFEFNHPDAWRCASPAFGGVGSAAGIAAFYAALTNARTPFSTATAVLAETEITSGQDRILHTLTSFSAGFQKDPFREDGVPVRRLFGGSRRAFGHPGAGGSFGFADPDRKTGVGFVLNVLEPGLFPAEDVRAMVELSLTFP